MQETSVVITTHGKKVCYTSGEGASSEKGHMIKAIWRDFDYGTYLDIMRLVIEDVKRESDVGKVYYERIEHDEVLLPELMRRLLVGLKGVNFEIDHDECDHLTDDSVAKIVALPPKLIRILCDPIRNCIMLSDGEMERLQRQCSVYFGNNTGGVENAHEGIMLHTILNGFWNDYGINYFDLKKLPVGVGVVLKEVQRFKNEAMAQEIKAVNTVGKPKSVGSGRRGRR